MTPAAQELTALGIPHREFTHPGPVRSLEQAARERGQKPDQVVRSILFRLNEDDYIMVVAAGPDQISWPALRKYIGQSRMTMAKPEEVLETTGFIVGSVSPFGLPQPIRTLLDRSVLQQQEVSIGSGVRGTTVFIRVSDLKKALGEVEIVDLLGTGK